MTEKNIIDIVIENLNRYPDIKFDKKNDGELEIFCLDDKGFDILLQADQRENTLHFGAFHWHYDNPLWSKFSDSVTSTYHNVSFQLTLAITKLTRFQPNPFLLHNR